MDEKTCIVNHSMSIQSILTIVYSSLFGNLETQYCCVKLLLKLKVEEIVLQIFNFQSHQDLKFNNLACVIMCILKS